MAGVSWGGMCGYSGGRLRRQRAMDEVMRRESGVRCLCKGGSLDVLVWNVSTRMHQSRLSDCALTVRCFAQPWDTVWVSCRGTGVVCAEGAQQRVSDTG
jgi:hypothetical protein